MKLCLAKERTRRVLFVLLAAAIATVWLYEYPLYTFLYFVNRYNAGDPLDPVPPLAVGDGVVLSLLGLLLLWVYLRPRSYLVPAHGGGPVRPSSTAPRSSPWTEPICESCA